ncbi:30b8ca44-7e46-4277-840a-cac9a1662dea [Thermothielavioides terrestris]|uniref:30b8ca44-7e46-4277-840a-cac9a1662dea n=1 Tax=Thermothielavioides terrestris TaxID=2587410 RepID=A0A3S4BM63_9PEZI|nr:30b8ca44-7e46-4277-840a-cac9a1662dea [Thermothielavioides terrestris]
MDPAAVFRNQSLGAAFQRPSQQPSQQHLLLGRPPAPGPYPWDKPENEAHDAPRRVAHTLTACYRCHEKKSRCDPTLPRCLACERSRSTCEYYDSTKGRWINRTYIVTLQKKVRELEAELAQFTEQEGEYPHDHDDMVFPGGIVRLDETDELPRYLGPSSGTAMIRLLMEKAKKLAESHRIANVIPAVLARRAERRDRMQSVVMGGSISGPSGRKRSYPAHSVIPASSLPSREIVDGLVRAFNDRVQVITPVLHEKTLEEDVKAVFAGDKDPYRHFVVNMVVAISLQKVGKYAGLPDSYYLNAMRRFEDVVRPQDLKTLQCLVLIGQYALSTPTRTANYYLAGLATRICQQMGLGDERTISLGVSDPLTLDMRRRLSWIVTAQEFSLAYNMGRPNGFAKSDDFMSVKFFEAVPDADITPEGIRHGRPCERKLVAIHFCKMRLLQAEIRRVLYEKKRPEPVHETHPWFTEMEQKLRGWLDSCPEQPAWCKPWLAAHYYNMIFALYRPSPQVPRPTSHAAVKCFEASRSIIDSTSQQIEQGIADINLEALLIIYASLNALLWSISYPEVRAEHPRDEVQDLAATALEAIKVFSDRWPGSSSAVQLYTSLANACLQSYDVGEETPSPSSSSQLGTPVSLAGSISPESEASKHTPVSQTQPQLATPLFNSSPFGYPFDAASDPLAAQYAFDHGPPPFPHQPTFRSNSIFMSPSTDANGRRLSHLAPDTTPSTGAPDSERTESSSPTLSATPKQEPTTTPAPAVRALPTPPESMVPPAIHPNNVSQSPGLAPGAGQAATPIPTPTLHAAGPAPPPQHIPVPVIQVKREAEELFFTPQFKPQHQQQQPGPPPRQPVPPPTFITPPQPSPQQRPPAPSSASTDWYNPLPPFVPPHAFSNAVAGGPTSFWEGPQAPFAATAPAAPYTQVAGGVVPRPYGNAAADWDFSWGPGPQQHQQQQHPQQQQQQQHQPPPQPDPWFPTGLAPPGGEYYASFLNGRHGSLSQEQQLELMDVLEAEGMNDIDSYLNMGGGVGWGAAPDAPGHGGAGAGVGVGPGVSAGPGGVNWG